MSIPEQQQVSEEPQSLQCGDAAVNTDVPEKPEDTGFLPRESPWDEIIDSQNFLLLDC